MMTLNTMTTALLVSTATAESSDDTTRTLLLTAALLGFLGFLVACISGIAMSVISGKAKKNDEPMEQSTRTRVLYWLNIGGFGTALLAYATMIFLSV